MAAALHAFRIVNVFAFAGDALTGNPLCVFEDGSAMDADLMQSLALQFNLSETTFVLPAELGHTARVRIFTPRYEMPFAGHPTLGTAHVCRSLGRGGDDIALEMQAGVIAVRARANRWTLTALKPTWREFELPRETLATALGLTAAEIGERPLWVNAGKEQLIVPLVSPSAVQRASPNAAAFAALRSMDDHAMAYVFACDDSHHATSRFFFPQGDAMLEDPATGSATANFGGWCLATGQSLPVQLTIAQGVQTGRPSQLFLSVTDKNGIEVSGEVIDVGRGTVTV